MVVTLDPPRHGPLRRAAMPRFTPRAIRSRHEEIDRIAVEVLDELAASDDAGEFDFVERVAAPLPIGVISWILGRARRGLAAAVPLDQRGHRQGRPRVPAAG